MALIYKLRNKCRRSLTGFHDHEDGATAVEFAILALPFFMILFGIIEFALVFYIDSTLQNATFEASRQIRVGQFTGGEAELETAICSEMNPNKTDSELGTCRGKLLVTVKKMGDFSGATSFAPVEAIDPNNPEPNFVASSGGETVIVKATYEYDLTVPGNLTGLSNTGDSSTREIKAITAFRNEPF